ncbi:MAG: LysR family transcriptional regulator [Chloroflexota bacterium]
MRTLDLNKVRVFVKVVEAGSITRAAEALYLPKSSVSRSLKQLETALGAQLLQRTPRGSKLTPAGRIFHQGAAQGMVAVEEARDAIAGLQGAPRGLVRVAAPLETAWLLTPVVASFLEKYPEVRVNMTMGSFPLDPALNGFDLVLFLGRPAYGKLEWRILGSSYSGLFASPDYLSRFGTPRLVDDLAAHECILYGAVDRHSVWSLIKEEQSERIEVRGRLEVDEIFAVYAAVRSGLGIGLLPLHLHSMATDQQSLVRVLPDYVAEEHVLQLATPTAHPVLSSVRLLSEAIVEEVACRCPRGSRTADMGTIELATMPGGRPREAR